jgi:hypothetical protein
VPVALSDIVVRCLKRNVDDRFESVVSLAEAIAPYAWYKHHESLARMRRAVGVRRAGGVTPGTASASVPPAAMTGNAAKTQDGAGGPGNKVLLALAAVVPLVLIPLAGILVVQRVGMGHKPPPEETQTSAQATPTPTELPAATITMTPAPVPSPTETAAQAAPTETVPVVPPPSAAADVSVDPQPTTAPSPTTQPVRALPRKRSILQQRY